MIAHDTIYNIAVGCGFAAGLGIFVVAKTRSGKDIHVVPLMESGLWGASLASALHLLYCAFDPSHLVFFMDTQGNAVHLEEGVLVKMDMLHRLHIAAGSVATMYIAGQSLHREWKADYLPAGGR